MNKMTLDGIWHIKSQDGRLDVDVRIPCTVFHALEKKGHFGKEGVSFKERNKECISLARQQFTYSTEFDWEKGILSKESKVFLECTGLDTLSTLNLNGTCIGKTENMHLRHSFEIGAHLKQGKNNLTLVFDDAVTYAEGKRDKRKLWTVQAPEIQTDTYNMIRKSHCSFGWDWGPIIPDAGIFRTVEINTFEHARITDILIRQHHTEKKVILEIDPQVSHWSSIPLEFEAALIHPTGFKETFTSSGQAPFHITVKDPELWWPNDMGSQSLYMLELKLKGQELTLDCATRKIGLRTIALNTQADEWGNKFQLEVNGIPLFAKGASYIPEDIFLSRTSTERTRSLLQDCKRAHFNTIRVWGGGTYPADHFYDLCDELGLLVWQDFMFACAYYDMKDPSFVSNITNEAEDVTRRIHHHASLALLCGNNEMEWATVAWAVENPEQYKEEYLYQYEKLLPDICQRICPDIPYWPASPSSGGKFDNPNDPNRGDVHYWDVWHGRKPFEDYSKHHFRFLSEFGFESLPDMETIETFTTKEDLNLFSPVMEEHQKCLSGNATIMHYLAQLFRFPKDFPSLITLSQILQAEAAQYGVEHLRRNRGRCMGAIYWQLNDNWPVISWSSIDHTGRWKALHYQMARSFRPILLSAEIRDTEAAIHLTNDTAETVKGSLCCRLRRMDGKIITEENLDVSCPARSAIEIARIRFPVASDSIEARSLYAWAEFASENTGRLTCNAALIKYKKLELPDPGLKAKIIRKDGQLCVKVDSKRFAKHIRLAIPGTKTLFGDNYFDMDAKQTRLIPIIETDASLWKARMRLKCHSLRDTYS